MYGPGRIRLFSAALAPPRESERAAGRLSGEAGLRLFIRMHIVFHEAPMALSPPVGVDWPRNVRILRDPESSQTKVCLWRAKEGEYFQRSFRQKCTFSFIILAFPCQCHREPGDGRWTQTGPFGQLHCPATPVPLSSAGCCVGPGLFVWFPSLLHHCD